MSGAATLGALWNGRGTTFRAFSQHCERIELCLFSPEGAETRHDLSAEGDGLWSLHLGDVEPGQRYGYRVHGPWRPESGHYFNPAKLLADPYALALTGEPTEDERLYGWDRDAPERPDTRDSAAVAAHSLVVDTGFDWRGDTRPGTPWTETVVYECHVRGLTARHLEVPEEQRGTYLGLASEPVLEHLRKLGVTAVELLPVQQIAREGALARRGMPNYFGYSPLGFLAPHAGYATSGGDPVDEFKEMVRRLHAAGFEVLIDVVLNHTAEGDHRGPTLSLRGFDNASYYRLDPSDPSRYQDFTGCGNTLDARQTAVLDLFVAMLAYWAGEMHVDGFRFDLATALARDDAFDPAGPFFERIDSHPLLRRVKLIAEPWDLGPGGYQLGSFPARWREWNDRFRDSVRRFWRGDEGSAEAMRQAMSGSPQVFTPPRDHTSSIDFITCHDGFTLQDLVSYERKHNEANGENNLDGRDENLSSNWGTEGPTSEASTVRRRERVQRSLIVSLALSRGVPMLLHGDEIGRTQLGNNNAYCQDGPLTWVDWDLDDGKQSLLHLSRAALTLRREVDLDAEPQVLSQNGRPLTDLRRARLPLLALLRSGPIDDLLTLMNATDRARTWRLPPPLNGGRWSVRLASFPAGPHSLRRTTVRVPGHSLLVLGRSVQRDDTG